MLTPPFKVPEDNGGTENQSSLRDDFPSVASLVFPLRQSEDFDQGARLQSGTGTPGTTLSSEGPS